MNPYFSFTKTYLAVTIDVWWVSKGVGMNYKNLKVPKHVGIIVDGNGRWAVSKGLSRSRGHEAGYRNLKKLGKYILSHEVKILSVYLFSTENFKRSNEEVDYLMRLFLKMFRKDISFFMKNNIKVIVSGRDVPLSNEVIVARDEMVRATKDNTGGILNICLNYGGRAEIVDAMRKMMLDFDKEEISNMNEEVVSKYLYQNLPDVDLLIRTSGEYRLSNFMLWQVSYAEFYFTDILFPDFSCRDFDDAILSYTKRDRRFGGIKK